MSSRLSLVHVEFGIQAILSRKKRRKEGKKITGLVRWLSE